MEKRGILFVFLIVFLFMFLVLILAPFVLGVDCPNIDTSCNWKDGKCCKLPKGGALVDAFAYCENGIVWDIHYCESDESCKEGMCVPKPQPTEPPPTPQPPPAPKKITYYQDKDRDGYGNPNVKKVSTLQPEGYVLNAGDCDDSNSNINPQAKEICDGVDNNCNGKIDEGCNLAISISLETDKEYLRKKSNGFINVEKYDEVVEIGNKTYKVATTTDKLVYSSSIAFPTDYPYDLPPENYYISISFVKFFSSAPNTSPNILTRFALNLRKDCAWDKEGKVAVCKGRYPLGEKNKGTLILGIAQLMIKAKKGSQNIGEAEFSNEIVVAKYVYYFVPLNSKDYGNVQEQYDSYTGLSEINNRIDLAGKAIFLNEINIPDIKEGEICSASSENFPKLKVQISDYLNKNLGNLLVTDSIIIVLSQPKLFYENVNGCTSFEKKALVFVRDNVHLRVLAHELGHRIGKLCDEYMLLAWALQFQIQACPNPISEDRKVDFPNCCSPRIVDCQEKEGVCLTRNPENFKELPYSCDVIGKGVSCYKPDCGKDSDCKKENSFCDEFTGRCIICEKNINTDYHGRCKLCPDTDESCNRYVMDRDKLGEACINCKSRGGNCHSSFGCKYANQQPKQCANTDTSCNFNKNMNECVDCTNYNARCSYDESDKNFRCKCANTDSSCSPSSSANGLVCNDCTVRGYACVKVEVPEFSTFFYRCESPVSEDEGECGGIFTCLGMPYEDAKGKIPKDINVPKPIKYHSIMGISKIPVSIYPENSVCPLKNC